MDERILRIEIIPETAISQRILNLEQPTEAISSGLTAIAQKLRQCWHDTEDIEQSLPKQNKSAIIFVTVIDLNIL